MLFVYMYYDFSPFDFNYFSKMSYDLSLFPWNMFLEGTILLESTSKQQHHADTAVIQTSSGKVFVRVW